MSRLSIHLPADWSLRRPPILEILLWLRTRRDRVRVLHAIAIDVDARVFQAFLDGLAFSALIAGEPDEEYEAFRAWLEHRIGTYGGGWWAALRTNHNGELGAINALLELAREFRRGHDRHGT